jgi:hypothetical protein
MTPITKELAGHAHCRGTRLHHAGRMIAVVCALANKLSRISNITRNDARIGSYQRH